MLARKNNFFFLSSGANFESDYAEFKKEIVENSMYVFDNFSKLSDLYDYLVIPVIEGTKELPNVGADWVFQYLTLTKLVKPKHYKTLKSVIVSHINKMNNEGEPNITMYYSKLDKIFKYLELNDPTYFS